MKKYTEKCFLIILSFFLLIASGCGNGASNKSAQKTSSAKSTSVKETSATEDTTWASEITVVFSTTSGSGTTTVSAAADSEEEVPLKEEEAPPETQIIPENGDESLIVEIAEALIGIDFAEGGTTPSQGFDNTGFLYYVLRQGGYVSFPRMIREQIAWGDNVGYEALKPGDVVYFTSEPGGSAEFGGIYAGNGEMIYCPYPGEKVRRADITMNYWVARFVTALSL